MKNTTKLITATLAGDKNAFAELIKTYEGLAVSEASRNLPNKDLIDDALQESFITAYTKLPELKNANAFPSWYRKIVRTSCRKIRNQQKSPLLCFDNLNDIIDPAPTPSEALFLKEEREKVWNILGMLKGDTREAFLQRHIQGRSYKDIATGLGVPLGTLKKRLHESRHVLIRELQKEEKNLIRVGCLPISDHLLAMVSHHMNDPRKLNIMLRKFLSWPSLVDSLKRCLLDVAFIMAPLALALRAAGIPIRYVLDAHQNGSAITVHRDSFFNKEEIVGRVGLPHEISTQSMILHHMSGSLPSLVDDAYQASYISPSYLNRSLKEGNIDAFFCAEPWNTKAVLEGTGRILAESSDFMPDHICCIVVVRESFAAMHGDILRDYLALLLRSSEEIETKPKLAAKIQAAYTGVPADVVETVLQRKTITYHNLIPENECIRAVMNMALHTGILGKSCNLDSFLTKDYL